MKNTVSPRDVVTFQYMAGVEVVFLLQRKNEAEKLVMNALNIDRTYRNCYEWIRYLSFLMFRRIRHNLKGTIDRVC